jgi:hypothetical protein
MLERLRQDFSMLNFGLGMLAGGLITLLVIVIVVRVLARVPEIPEVAFDSGPPDLRLALSRELLQRLVDDALQDVSLPLIALRDPYLELESGGVLLVRLRGDTVLLGAQPITLRLRLVPAEVGVGVVTESADVGVFGNVAGPLTDQLDASINAELAQRLAFAQEFAVTGVDGTTDEVIVAARLKE